jgi:phage-related protein
VGNLGSLLFNAGVNVVQGLINGITSRIGAVASAASRLAGAVRGALPFSPAKYGPLSGKGAPERSGRKIAQDVARGLLKGRAGLHGAMARAMPGVPGAGLGLAGAGAGGRVHVTLGPGAVQVTGVGGNLTLRDVQGAVAAGISEGVRLLEQGRRF